MAEQLTFDWPNGVALGVDDFFVSPSNSIAYALLQNPDTWPQRKLIITGPAGSGKSHLAGIFKQNFEAVQLGFAALSNLPDDGAFVIVEDTDQLPDDAQEPLFHLHNHLQNTGGTLLLTARTPPNRWPITLPDLASRMQATTVATIEEPDDALLQALFMKLFADRQISPAPELIPYMAKRCERSFDAVSHLVERMDRTALEENKPITRALARRLLDNSDFDG